jgi:hypothetical protein
MRMLRVESAFIGDCGGGDGGGGKGREGGGVR